MCCGLTFGHLLAELHDSAQVTVDGGVGVRDGGLGLRQPLGDDTPHIRGRDLCEGALRQERRKERTEQRTVSHCADLYFWTTL